MRNLLVSLLLVGSFCSPCWAGASRDFASASSQNIFIGDPSVLILNRDFTVMCWFKHTTTGADDALISHGCGEWYLRIASSNKLDFLESNQADVLQGNTEITSTTTWNHATFTMSSGSTGTITLWLNGVSDGSTTTTRTFDDNGNPIGVTIGSDTNCSSIYTEFFQGVISYGQIFNRELNKMEIQQAMYIPGSVSGLVGYWGLWGSNSPEIDLSGQGNSGTVNGATESSDGPPVMLSIGIVQ